MWGYVFVQSRPTENSLQGRQTKEIQKFLQARTTERSVCQLQRSRCVITLLPCCVSFVPQVLGKWQGQVQVQVMQARSWDRRRKCTAKKSACAPAPLLSTWCSLLQSTKQPDSTHWGRPANRVREFQLRGTWHACEP